MTVTASIVPHLTPAQIAAIRHYTNGVIAARRSYAEDGLACSRASDEATVVSDWRFGYISRAQMQDALADIRRRYPR